MFDILNPHAFFLNNDYNISFGTTWLHTIEKIHTKIVENLPLLEVDEQGYYSRQEQYELLLQNITDIDSDFHNQLVVKKN